MTTAHSRRLASACLTGAAATLALGLTATEAGAEPAPAAPSPAAVAAAYEAAGSPRTLETLSRFFARDGAVSRAAADPKVGRETVPVHYLSPRFVAGDSGAPVGEVQFLATAAVSSDGQKASVWTARQGGEWQVVNIATGDDETRHAALGARKLPGGTVFQEPQIGAWYVQRGNRVLPLDEDARKAIGTRGTSLTAYRDRVHRAYADKLPGSAYDRKGEAGGFDQGGGTAQAPGSAKGAQASGTAPVQQAQAGGESSGSAVTVASALAGTGALAALGLCGARLLRARRRTG
ncbi:hypothetical protein HUT18_05100 [Streptomyces sp. NA04227]|uniref:hypothetical protein n=1 Tax=Streptomyces sp. NA04227 TaxID=2742136 RepID=UPI001591A65A|nr:hypothetical protein [Streptomyces sp. NA04227]QKW05855.1 hypothetical protein HUT18_05100 [Streptomyces sp. NA04227]